MPEPSVYRCLNTLSAMGYESSPSYGSRISWCARTGQSRVVWGVLDCTKEQVAQALNLHARCMEP